MPDNLGVDPNYSVGDQTPLETRTTWTERPEWRARVNIPQQQTEVTFGSINHPRRVTNKRGELLAEAERIVNGARNVQYGDPNADFARTARYWNTHIAGVFERKMHELSAVVDASVTLAPDATADMLRDLLDPHDVAILMDLLKTSRQAWSPDVADHWLDKAGYAACGYDASPALLDSPGTST